VLRIRGPFVCNCVHGAVLKDGARVDDSLVLLSVWCRVEGGG